jgi:hypothetical protein
MLRTTPILEEAERLDVIAGLLALRRDGHFWALHVDAMRLKIRWEEDGPLLLLGWREAARMVSTAREVAAQLPAEGIPIVRKPPVAERPQRALRAKGAGSGLR